MPYTQIKITSYTGHVYAEAGVFVTVVADHGNVVIVSDGKKSFSCDRSKLTEEIPTELIKPDPAEERLRIAMADELKKGRTKFKTLVGCVKDGLINKPMPNGITKEKWLSIANEILQ